MLEARQALNNVVYLIPTLKLTSPVTDKRLRLRCNMDRTLDRTILGTARRAQFTGVCITNSQREQRSPRFRAYFQGPLRAQGIGGSAQRERGEVQAHLRPIAHRGCPSLRKGRTLCPDE